MLDVEAICRGAGRIDRSEPGGAPQELLVQRPQPLRPDEHLVVEARRRERPADLVRDRHPVPIERADDVLALDDDALAERLGADADVGIAVHRHLAVRAVPGAAEQPSGPVVLEAAGEDAPPGRVQGRRDRVAAISRRAVDREALAPVDTLVWACREARSAGGDLSAACGFGAGLREPGAHDLVRVGIALGEEPGLAAVRRNHHSAARPPRCRGSRCSRQLPERRRGLRPPRHSPEQRNSSTSRGPQLGQVRRRDIDVCCAQRNAVLDVRNGIQSP